MKKLLVLFLIFLLGCGKNEDKYVLSNDLSKNDLTIKTIDEILNRKSVKDNFETNNCYFSYINKILRLKNSNYLFLVKDKIVLLDSNFRILKQIKAGGKGPGEYTYLQDIKTYGDSLYAFDLSLNKLLIYSLDGRWIRDMLFSQPVLNAAANDNKIVAATVPYGENNNSVIEYDKRGNIIRRYGTIDIKKENITKQPYAANIYFTPGEQILLVFKINGSMYLYDKNGKAIQRFSIQNGAEYKKDLEFENKLEKNSKYGKSYPHRITNVEFDRQGNIFVNYGGLFSNKVRTLLVIFNSKGEYVKRILDDGNIMQTPFSFAIGLNDTLLLHTNSFKLFRATYK